MKFFEKKCSIEVLENCDYDAVFGGDVCVCGRVYNFDPLGNDMDITAEETTCQTDDDCKIVCCTTTDESSVFYYGCEKVSISKMKSCITSS